MKTVEIVGMAIFGLLVLGALARSVWEGAQLRKQVARYASGRGIRVSSEEDPRLATLLEQLTPDSIWRTHSVMPVEQAPHSLYLFGYDVRSKDSRSSSWTGFACLAEHATTGPEWPVTIFSRTPVVDKLVEDRVETGGEEFRRKFTVTCSNAGAALVTVSADVQRVLLEHAAGPGWYMSVTIARKGVLASSHWAQTEQEWDYLIALTKKLRVAVRY